MRTGTWILLLGSLGLVVACSAGEGEDATDGGATGEASESEPVSATRAEFERIAEELLSAPDDLSGPLGGGWISATRDGADKLRAELARSDLSPADRPLLEERLAGRLVADGETDEAVDLYQRLIAREPAGSQKRLQLLRDLGLAWLRQAETKNCVTRHNRDCCIFPLQGGGRHDVEEPARQAWKCFHEFMQHKPDNVRVRWLLNVTAMALGEYPDSVPEAMRIPLESFASEADVGRFVDVAPELGIDTFNMGGGVAIEDFDGDGRLDILTSTYDPLGPLTFYANRGSAGFENRSRQAGTDQQLGGINLIAGDPDDDGDFDAFVLRGAWLTARGSIRRSLLQNDGGRFSDVTAEAGLLENPRPTQTAAFGDLDDDGDLELVVGCESRVEVTADEDYPCQLFRNDGRTSDGVPHFVDVAAAAGVENDLYCKGVALGDYDDDGDLDAYFSNFGPNRLYRNDGELRFTDVARRLGVEEPVGRSFATWFFDADNDGRLDLFVASYRGDVATLAAEALGETRDIAPPRLYHNTGGRFEDVTRSAGLWRFFLPMGANFGDIDEDGWLDVYLGTGSPDLDALMPNAMLRNAGGLRFQDVTMSSGTGHLQKGHGIGFADLDQDGDSDVYHQLGGFFPVDRFHSALFRNPGHGRHFLHLRLRATRGNRQAIGARVHVRVATPEGARSIHRAVGSVASFGGSPLLQEIGLGDATRIERLEIVWPTSRAVSVFEDVPLDRRVTATEGTSELRVEELDPSQW